MVTPHRRKHSLRPLEHVPAATSGASDLQVDFSLLGPALNNRTIYEDDHDPPGHQAPVLGLK